MVTSNAMRKAFSLIELVVAMLVLSAIMAIAVVGYSQFTDSVEYDIASLNAETVFTAATAHALRVNEFSTDVHALPVPEDVVVVDGVAMAFGEVSIAVGVDGDFALSSYVAEGHCIVKQVEHPGDLHAPARDYFGLCDAAGHLLSAQQR